MNLAILSKIGGASAFVGSSGFLLVMILFPKYLGFNSNAHIYAIGETVSSGQVSTPEIKHNKDKNYQCKFSNDVIVDCTVTHWNPTNKNPKNQYKIDSLVNHKHDEINATNIKATDKIFRIVISSDDWDSKYQNIQLQETNIEVIVNGTSSQIYAKLKPIFGKYEGKHMIKVSYFVGTFEINDTDIKSTEKLNCSLVDDVVNSTESTTENCKITEFTETENEDQKKQTYDQLTFKKPTTTTPTKLEKNKRYLIQFTEKQDHQNADIKFVDKIINAKTTTTNPPAEKNLQFKTIKAAFYDGKSDHIFTF